MHRQSVMMTICDTSEQALLAESDNRNLPGASQQQEMDQMLANKQSLQASFDAQTQKLADLQEAYDRQD